jgi:hypothetical protein
MLQQKAKRSYLHTHVWNIPTVVTTEILVVCYTEKIDTAPVQPISLDKFPCGKQNKGVWLLTLVNSLPLGFLLPLWVFLPNPNSGFWWEAFASSSLRPSSKGRCPLSFFSLLPSQKGCSKGYSQVSKSFTWGRARDGDWRLSFIIKYFLVSFVFCEHIFF